MNFLINYQVLNSKGHVIKNGTMRVKNKPSEFVAKCELEIYLKKTVDGFVRLIVVTCKEDKPEKPEKSIDDIFKSFGDIFGSSFGDIFGDKKK
jgi:hypothetical protein